MKVVVTGGFGFIGSNLVEFLNKQGVVPIIFEHDKGLNSWRNVTGLKFELYTGNTYNILYSSSSRFICKPDIIIHLGANVDTTENMNDFLWQNNVVETLTLASYCKNRGIRFVFASSAAIYGAEERDFDDKRIDYKQLNPYAFTKSYVENNLNLQEVVALRFFNVYGKNERHKGEMASVIHKALHGGLIQRNDMGHGFYLDKWALFKSDRTDVADGEQKRDFIHVDDVCKIIWHFANNTNTGTYNVGTGQARTFKDLVKIIDPNRNITYVDMPPSVALSYQYFTQANTEKLRNIGGYKEKFLTLEEGIAKMKADLDIK